MMSRLQPTDTSLCDPNSPLDTEIPCFVVSPRDDPTLLSVDDLRDHQWCDPAYQAVISHWGGCPSLDMDEHGFMGHMGPSGEFQVIVPDTIPALDPIALVRELFDLDKPISSSCTCDEDTTDLGRGSLLRFHLWVVRIVFPLWGVLNPWFRSPWL
jgi:hypothetical protein